MADAGKAHLMRKWSFCKCLNVGRLIYSKKTVKNLARGLEITSKSET